MTNLFKKFLGKNFLPPPWFTGFCVAKIWNSGWALISMFNSGTNKHCLSSKTEFSPSKMLWLAKFISSIIIQSPFFIAVNNTPSTHLNFTLLSLVGNWLPTKSIISVCSLRLILWIFLLIFLAKFCTIVVFPIPGLPSINIGFLINMPLIIFNTLYFRVSVSKINSWQSLLFSLLSIIILLLCFLFKIKSLTPKLFSSSINTNCSSILFFVVNLFKIDSFNFDNNSGTKDSFKYSPSIIVICIAW